MERFKQLYPLPALLLDLYLVLFVVLAFNPYDRGVWWAENIPIILIVVGLVVLWFRGVRFSNTSYVLMSVLIYLHTIGGHFTFERVPFEFVTDFFGFERNHYDRIAHFSVGFYAYPIAEWLYSKKQVTDKAILILFPIFAIAAVAAGYEIIEWWFAAGAGASAETAASFLGSQGDVWDAQRDMLADILGAILAVSLYTIFKTDLRK